MSIERPRSDNLEKNETSLFILHYLKTNRGEELSKKFSVEEISLGISEIFNLIDSWKIEFDLENSEKKETAKEELRKIYKTYPREILDLYEKRDVKLMIVFLKNIGFSNEEIKDFFGEAINEIDWNEIKGSVKEKTIH